MDRKISHQPLTGASESCLLIHLPCWKHSSKSSSRPVPSSNHNAKTCRKVGFQTSSSGWERTTHTTSRSLTSMSRVCKTARGGAPLLRWQAGRVQTRQHSRHGHSRLRGAAGFKFAGGRQRSGMAQLTVRPAAPSPHSAIQAQCNRVRVPSSHCNNVASPATHNTAGVTGDPWHCWSSHWRTGCENIVENLKRHAALFKVSPRPPRARQRGNLALCDMQFERRINE